MTDTNGPMSFPEFRAYLENVREAAAIARRAVSNDYEAMRAVDRRANMHISRVVGFPTTVTEQIRRNRALRSMGVPYEGPVPDPMPERRQHRRNPTFKSFGRPRRGF